MRFWPWASRGCGSISYIIVSTRISGSILLIRIIVHRNDAWARNRQNCLARLDCTRRRPQRWMASLMDLSWTSWHIWQISHLVTETWDCVEGCPKWWDRSWRVMAKWSHLDFEVQICKVKLQAELLRSDSRLGSLIILSSAVHTRIEVCRMDLEMSRLVEQPWLQLMCCAVCLLHSRNFRCWEEVQDRSECWLVCCHWILEIEFNKRLSSSIIRLAIYSVTTSLIYKLIV